MQATAPLPDRAAALLDFWFGSPGDPDRERHRPIWFKSTDEFDAALRREFLADYEAAATGALLSWEASPEGALALVLLLDQVPRNIFRGTPRAYATDVAACVTADRALDRGFDQLVPPAWRLFFYMPFHHSESIADQRRSVALSNALPRNPDRGGSLRRYGHPYIEVIERFGRFPHRNDILGRQSTPEEIAFLAERDLARRAAREAEQLGGEADRPTLHDERGDHQDEDAGEQPLVAIGIGQGRDDAEIDRHRAAQPDP
jgi:uncharacterized protein (DUF924 family)